ncbi:MAG: hypothetical protein BRD37_06840 [Bacteroidetes bacterium QH_8_67_23]|nr:MAG: hypothetical protein BRD37_06840 [Bacteroidetes bacterium QH_8_67_23]
MEDCPCGRRTTGERHHRGRYRTSRLSAQDRDWTEAVARRQNSAAGRSRSPPSTSSPVEIEDEAIREVIYRDYRIVYVVDRDKEEVEVLTIFHSAQQFGTLGSGDN